MILKRDVAPVAGQGHPSLSRAAPSTSSKQDQKHPCGEIPKKKKKKVSLCPKFQVLGVWRETARVIPPLSENRMYQLARQEARSGPGQPLSRGSCAPGAVGGSVLL